jgi:hypothetical protein
MDIVSCIHREQEGLPDVAAGHYEHALGLWPSGAVGRAAASLSLAKLLRKRATQKEHLDRIEALLRVSSAVLHWRD